MLNLFIQIIFILTKPFGEMWWAEASVFNVLLNYCIFVLLSVCLKGFETPLKKIYNFMCLIKVTIRMKMKFRMNNLEGERGENLSLLLTQLGKTILCFQSFTVLCSD